MNLTHKIEIFPDEFVSSLIKANCDYARYIWNVGLGWFNELKDKPFVNKYLFHEYLCGKTREWKKFEK